MHFVHLETIVNHESYYTWFPFFLFNVVNACAQVDALVDVGSYKLHFKIIKGKGAPILFESGGALDAGQWDSISTVLYRKLNATIITNDRQGFGQSGLDTLKFNRLNEVKGLEYALEKLGCANKNKLLVCHSFRAFYSRLYAFRHHHIVKGIIILDPRIPSYSDMKFARSVSAKLNRNNFSKNELGLYYVLTEMERNSNFVRKKTIPSNIPIFDIMADQGPFNTFFEHIDAVQGDAVLKKRLIGEMKFIRAWCYFDLVSRNGGVPLITKTYNLSDDNYLAARNTYDECMNLVVKELDEAIDELPLSFSGAEIGRVTRGAALSLKSRALLYAASPLNNPGNDRSKWVDAAKAAKAVIDLGAYSLYQGADYKQIFLEKFNTEVILSFNINATQNPSGVYESMLNVIIGPNGYHGWSSYTPSQTLVDQFPMKNGLQISDSGSQYDPAHPYENRDPRFYADILYNGADFRGRSYESFIGGFDSPQSSIENWNASLTGYNWRKYSNDELPIDENIGIDQNWIIFRYSEIYLNYAEAAYGTGNEARAGEYLNLVRAKLSVKMPPVLSSGAALLKAIQLERQIELCFEGHRFFDVRRWKIAMQTENQPLRGVHIQKNPNGVFSYSYFILQNRKFYEQNYLCPIPKYELDKNKELTQNPNY